MSVKIKISTIGIISIFLSVCGFGQQTTNSGDLKVYKQATKIDHDPEITKKDTAVIAYCQIFFKKRSENDSIVIYNTDNQEIIDLINRCVKKIDFPKSYRKKSSIVIPYIFKNGDESKNIYSKLTVTAINLTVPYGKLGSTDINSLTFIRPVIFVTFGPRPSIK